MSRQVGNSALPPIKPDQLQPQVSLFQTPLKQKDSHLITSFQTNKPTQVTSTQATVGPQSGPREPAVPQDGFGLCEWNTIDPKDLGMARVTGTAGGLACGIAWCSAWCWVLQVLCALQKSCCAALPRVWDRASTVEKVASKRKRASQDS